jgi:uncharacterized DUF497 family protein
MAVHYEWDHEKNLANQRKHGLSFEEAAKLLDNVDRYLEIFDTEHSLEEDRFIAIGPINRGVIVVVYTERQGDAIRIIGARFATNSEISLLESFLREQR